MTVSVSVLLTAPAAACPSADRPCVVKPHEPPIAALGAKPVQLRIAPRATDEPEMPWIWQVLRNEVYSRMPRYEESKQFSLVLSPVVVKSPSDTIPGVGVAGDF